MFKLQKSTNPSFHIGNIQEVNTLRPRSHVMEVAEIISQDGRHRWINRHINPRVLFSYD